MTSRATAFAEENRFPVRGAPGWECGIVLSCEIPEISNNSFKPLLAEGAEAGHAGSGYAIGDNTENIGRRKFLDRNTADDVRRALGP